MDLSGNLLNAVKDAIKNRLLTWHQITWIDKNGQPPKCEIRTGYRMPPDNKATYDALAEIAKAGVEIEWYCCQDENMMCQPGGYLSFWDSKTSWEASDESADEDLSRLSNGRTSDEPS